MKYINTKIFINACNLNNFVKMAIYSKKALDINENINRLRHKVFFIEMMKLF